MGLTNLLKNKIKSLSLFSVVTKLIIAFACVSSAELIFYNTVFFKEAFFEKIDFIPHMIIVGIIFILTLFFDNGLDPYLVLSSVTVLMFISCYQADSVYFTLICSAVFAGFVFVYLDYMTPHDLGKKTTVIVAVILFLFFATYVSLFSVINYHCHLTPNFDFGIFVQMFANMKKTLLPVTTCERDKLLSHFAVHFSPILYLILPFYCVFSNADTLSVFQAVCVASGIIPLYLFCKKQNLSNNKTTCFLIMFGVSCIFLSANNYYFHENCFLTPLILWLFVALENDKKAYYIIPSILILSVKEDAWIYLFFTALYLFFSAEKSKRKILRALLLFVLSLSYFIVVSKIMGIYGEGVMADRYDIFFLTRDDSVFKVVINVLKNPIYVLKTAISQEKIPFIVYMLFPLAFLPVFIKKRARIILLFPMLLINLMTDYCYQYDIGFQYTYASAAFLFVAAIMNANDISPKYSKKLLTTAVFVSVFFFAQTQFGHVSNSIKYYETHKNDIIKINEVLDSIPEDASVSADTFLCPYLSNRDELYQRDITTHETDYLVFDLRNQTASESEESLEEKGYELYNYSENLVVVYKKK